MKRPFITAMPSVALLITLASCGTTTYTHNTNHRTTRHLENTEAITTSRTYSFHGLDVDNNGCVISGIIKQEDTRKAQETYRAIETYDKVTRVTRRETVLECMLGATGRLVMEEGPQYLIVSPIMIAIGIVVLPFEIISWHGFGDTKILSKKRTGSGPQKRGTRTLKKDLPSRRSDAGGVKVVASNKTLKSFDDLTTPGGRFLITYNLPDHLTKENSVSKARDLISSIFLDPDSASSLLDSVAFMAENPIRVNIATDKFASRADGLPLKRIIDARTSVKVAGFTFKKGILLKAIAEHLNKLALDAIAVKKVKATITAKDILSHADIKGNAKMEASFVNGVSVSTMKNQMRATLTKHIKPNFVDRYMPPDSALPKILKLPKKFKFHNGATVTVHVPSKYKIKVTHPEYLYVVGQKEITPESPDITIYMEEKGSKHRVVSIKEGTTPGRIE